MGGEKLFIWPCQQRSEMKEAQPTKRSLFLLLSSQPGSIIFSPPPSDVWFVGGRSKEKEKQLSKTGRGEKYNNNNKKLQLFCLPYEKEIWKQFLWDVINFLEENWMQFL